MEIEIFFRMGLCSLSKTLLLQEKLFSKGLLVSRRAAKMKTAELLLSFHGSAPIYLKDKYFWLLGAHRGPHKRGYLG